MIIGGQSFYHSVVPDCSVERCVEYFNGVSFDMLDKFPEPAVENTALTVNNVLHVFGISLDEFPLENIIPAVFYNYQGYISIKREPMDFI